MIKMYKNRVSGDQNKKTNSKQHRIDIISHYKTCTHTRIHTDTQLIFVSVFHHKSSPSHISLNF